jgi:hypothetical protein
VRCSKGKAKRRKIAKVAKNVAAMKGGRVFMDISSINVKSKGGNKFWLLLQDELTNCIWSFFLKQKSDLTIYECNWLQRTKKDGIKNQILRCDNAGENKSLQHKIDTTPDFHIHFENTAPYNSEHNVQLKENFKHYVVKLAP